MVLNEQLTKETKQRAKLLKLMSNPVRLCILHQLSNQDKCNVSYFVNCMNASQPNISQHLARLKASDILGIEKKGTEVHYFIKNQHIKDLVKLVFEE